MSKKNFIPSFTADEVIFGAHFIHNERRSKKSRDVDNGESARLTNNIAKWVNQPNRFDIAGIDTKIRRKPTGYSKAKGRRAANKLQKHFGRGT